MAFKLENNNNSKTIENRDFSIQKLLETEITLFKKSFSNKKK